MKKKTRIKLSLTTFLFVIAPVLSLASNLTACAQLKTNFAGDSTNNKLAQVTESRSAKEPVGWQKNGILLVYPKNNASINSASTFLIGSVNSGEKLFCNGQEIRVSPEGYYAHVVKLSAGKNDFSLSKSAEAAEPMLVSISRPAPESTLANTSLQILAKSLQPQEELGLMPGDILQLAARATPGSIVTAHFANRILPLKPVYDPKKGHKASSVKLGTDTAFGVSYQSGPAAQKDLYLGFYKVQAQDNWKKTKIIFQASKAGSQINQQAKGNISTISQPFVLNTKHNDTIVRLGPGAARITPLAKDVRLFCDGYKGVWRRILLCPNRHVWILNEDLTADPDNNSLPETKVSTINLESDSYGAKIIVPLNQRLPYQIEHELKPNKLTLHIFGATADTDFITADSLNQADSSCHKLIEQVAWKQKGDLHYELTVQLKQPQSWGFHADYEDSNLVLHIKNPPKLEAGTDSLKGFVVCLDPGHGGLESGSIGCGGVKESTINLAITRLLRQELEKMGASVIMTRNDDIDVGLAKRVETAISAKADLLLSIHNNALPDGRDPWKELGTSSYWYHPQSTGLARYAKDRLAQASGLPDYGCRYQNLALCRPSQMPAMLMEIGFMISPNEYALLIEPSFQEKVAKSLAESVKAFIRGTASSQD